MLTLTLVLIGVAMVVGSGAVIGLCLVPKPPPAGGQRSITPGGHKR